MRTHIRFIAFALVLIAGIFLAACGPLPAGAKLQINPDGKSARVEFSGQVDSIAADLWMIAGQKVAITARTDIEGNIAVGDMVKVAATVTSDASITADRIELSVSDQVSTPGAIAWRKGPDKDHGPNDSTEIDKIGEFNLVGKVDSIATDQWFIAGLAFAITADTHINGQFSVGDMVHVHAKINPDGTFMANEIGPVSQGAQTNGELVMTGTVDAIAPDQWTISGVAFAIDPSTNIIGTITVGDRVKVVAQVDASGSLLAREIRSVNPVEDSPKPPEQAGTRMEFTGVVSSIGKEAWTIDGKTFVIADKTEIDGTIVIGDTVKVEASVSLDGTLTALEIEKIDMTETAPGPHSGDNHHHHTPGGNPPGDKHQGSDHGSEP